MRWRAQVAYDGSDFVGWQTQNGRGNTVQESLERVLATVLREKVRIHGSGRTDTGVHARGQVVAFDTVEAIEDLRGTVYSVNALLPDSVAMSALGPAPDAFDPRRDAVRRTYRYRIWNAEEPSPFEVRTAWHVHEALDVSAMQLAADAIVGLHDFASFQAADKIERSSVREVMVAQVVRKADLVEFEITANAFCRGMVRNLTGQLVEVGRGRVPASGMRGILAARDRGCAAAAAPPQGLFLEKVEYE